MDDWQAQQQQDERQRMDELAQILQAAKMRPLNPDEIDVIAWETGYMQQRSRL